MRTKVFIVLAVLHAIPCLAKVTVQEYTLPEIQGFPYKTVVSGDWIIAILNTDPQIVVKSGLLAYDCKANKVYTIHKGVANWPAITGTTAMWSCKGDAIEALRGTEAKDLQNENLVLYDLATGRFSWPNLKPAVTIGTAVSGSHVVYESGGRIYLYDLSSESVKQVSGEDQNCHYPDIAGDLVVWQCDTKQNRSKICGYQISTTQPFSVTDDSKSRNTACTDGQWVIWADDDGVQCFNTQTHDTRLISSAKFPDVANNFVVYTKMIPSGPRARKRIVFGTDLRTGEELQISQDQTERSPYITGNRVAWPQGSVLHYADLTRM